jgi:hypothetical protein
MAWKGQPINRQQRIRAFFAIRILFGKGDKKNTTLRSKRGVLSVLADGCDYSRL